MDGITESIFIEIKSDKSKNISVGRVYRHNCKFDKFMKNFFENLIKSACDKANNKNINLWEISILTYLKLILIKMCQILCLLLASVL